MHIGGTLITGLVRILVVVATLAAVYYFLVRPVLDTTEKVSSGISGNIQQSLNQADSLFNQTDVSQGMQMQITRDIRNVPPNKAQRLGKCINRKPGDIAHLKRCASRLSR